MTSTNEISPPSADRVKAPQDAPLAPIDQQRLDGIVSASGTKRAELVSNLAQNILGQNTVSDGKVAGQKPEVLQNFENFVLLIATLKSMFAKDPQSLERVEQNIPYDLFAAIEDVGDKDDDNLDQKKSEALAKKYKESADKSPDATRRRILDVAFSKLGSTEFRGKEVAGGNLACAQVATSILCKALKGTDIANHMQRPLLGVAATKKQLIDKGWKVHSGPPKPGDVVIWNRTQKKTKNNEVVLGHGHVGIVIDETQAISNSSSLKTPRIHPFNTGYWKQRGVETFLSPPDKAVA